MDCVSLFLSSSLYLTFAVSGVSDSESFPWISIYLYSPSLNITSSGVFSFSSSEDEKNWHILLDNFLASGFRNTDTMDVLLLICCSILMVFNYDLFLSFLSFSYLDSFCSILMNNVKCNILQIDDISLDCPSFYQVKFLCWAYHFIGFLFFFFFFSISLFPMSPFLRRRIFD